MPRLSPNSLPSYRLHKQSGQAIVTLGGRDFTLGKHGSPESKVKYERLVSEWLAAGRRAPTSASDLTVVELLAAYWQYAQGYYRRPDGSPSDELSCIKKALKVVRRLYGRTPAAEFGPLALKATRTEMVSSWLVSNVHQRTGRAHPPSIQMGDGERDGATFPAPRPSRRIRVAARALRGARKRTGPPRRDRTR